MHPRLVHAARKGDATRGSEWCVSRAYVCASVRARAQLPSSHHHSLHQIILCSRCRSLFRLAKFYCTTHFHPPLKTAKVTTSGSRMSAKNPGMSSLLLSFTPFNFASTYYKFSPYLFSISNNLVNYLLFSNFQSA